ncbi:MAG: exodeoxyribonuclease V subunit gamma, partial [Candidatus Eisenbacteria sp.]|nr:exodeoxyribonuclease V subunit gamma [Candidatus Eisenbacteria bacterium]
QAGPAGDSSKHANTQAGPAGDSSKHATTQGGPPGDVSLIRHAHPYHEVLAWARLIDHRTRVSPEPVRYRDIAVLVRDLESYRPILREVFRRFGIPFFIDERRDATAHPLVRLCLSALQVASQRWSREAVISMIRNPILGLSQDTVDRIENLSIEYGIEYERWWETSWETFTLPERERLSRARGIDTDDADDQQNALQEEIDTQTQVEAAQSTQPNAVQRRRQLSATEARAVSSRLFPGLRAFTDIWHSREPAYAEAAAALLNLLRTCLRKAATGLNFTSWSQHESKQIITLIEETLVTGIELMGSVPVSAGSFTRLLRDAFSGASVGATPRILDAVIVAEPRRSRVNEARCVILGGLDASSFPRPYAQDPFFTDQERQEMASRRLPVTPSAMLQAEEDPYLFYIACTRASDELILSLSDQGSDGAAQEPSPYLREVTGILGPLQEPAGAHEAGPGPLPACQHPWELPVRLAETLRALSPPDQEQLISQARDHLPSAHEAIHHSVTCAHRICRPLPDALAPETAAEMFPTGVITASASQLEKFAQCPFQHFA